jgi:hypothetical protein
MRRPISDPVVYGFPGSTCVNIVRLILTHKDVPYSFHDALRQSGMAGRTRPGIPTFRIRALQAAE